MKTKIVVLALVWAVFLGVVAWRVAGSGTIESLAESVKCGAGQCPLQVAAVTPAVTPAQPGRIPSVWPPRVGEPYPDLELVDQTGQLVRLSSLKGSVLLIEPVGMNCPACQSFAGAHRLGPYEGIQPQGGLPSIEELVPQYARGVSLSDERIVYVQLLLYSMTMEAPTPEDARKWAQHFRADRAKNQIVLAGTKEFIGQASYDMIPGFQLVDRNFILQVDATGHRPQHNLFTQLLPAIPRLLEERPMKLSAIESVATADRPAAVERAYRAIPHRRTVFDVSAATMSPDERAYLRRMFELVDLGIVERVETLGWLRSRDENEPSVESYDQVVSQLGALTVPPRLASVHRLVSEAMVEQRAALTEWRKTAVPANLPAHPLVASSSGKLRRAYGELLALFPQENEHNKAAFFDYLCAMDFI
ncbi:MAG TPA: hypothetical protein VL086_17875 [Candidatus Nitrosotalea sp.]|nr:hypothetical protein [Candidatus Nitrosotalea sp.]